MAYHLALRDDIRRARFDPSGPRPMGFENVIGESEAIRRAVEAARNAAEARSRAILIRGEAGVGKDLFARAIHYAGPDPDSPFLSLDCSTIPGPLLESELCGDERGAVTRSGGSKQGLLELAGAGTVFLDRVDELPSNLHPKLLRALGERRIRRVGGLEEVELHCRIVTATTRSVEGMVAKGTLWEDLFLQLNVVTITVPPLRERKGDPEILAHHFLRILARDRGIPVGVPTPEAIEVLQEHPWPGNVRELKHVIERAAVAADGDPIRTVHLTGRDRRDPSASASGGATAGRITIPPGGLSLEQLEAQALRITLDITGGNKSATARILGCSRPTVSRKIDLYDLEPRDREAS